MAKRNLIAGPWVGEFGWELMGWHACLRSLSKDYDVIVLASENTKYLYEDFCTKYITFEKSDITKNHSDGYFYEGYDINLLQKHVLEKLSEQNILKDDLLWLPPHKIINTPGSTYHKFDQEFFFNEKKYIPKYKTLGVANEKNIYIFHARGRQDVRPADNWSIKNWEELRDLILESDKNANIYCFGSTKDSYCIENTIDYRGKNLEEVCKLINNCFVFGPSSGGMHLASQSKSNVIVWSTQYNKKRYMQWWNPHNTPTLYLEKYEWHPSPKYVFDMFAKWNKKSIISDI